MQDIFRLRRCFYLLNQSYLIAAGNKRSKKRCLRKLKQAKAMRTRGYVTDKQRLISMFN